MVINKINAEVLKMAQLIDSRWDDIFNRKDNLQCYEYILIASEQFGVPSITLYKTQSYTTNIKIISFSKYGSTSVIDTNGSVFSWGTLILTTLSDDINITEEGATTHQTYTIPYGRDCTQEEREFSVDLMYDDDLVRDFLCTVLKMQNMALVNVNHVQYNFNSLVDMSDGTIYNTLMSRPFFKIGAQK